MDQFNYESIKDLALTIIDDLSKSEYVSVISGPSITMGLFRYFMSLYGAHLSLSEYDEDYDKEYWVTIHCEDDILKFSVAEAYSYESGKYLGGPTGIAYIHSDVPSKCIFDIENNPFSGKNDFIIFDIVNGYHEDDECFEYEGYDYCPEDCDGCPESIDCPFTERCDSDEDNITTHSSSLTTIKNDDGTLRGFTHSHTYSDNDDCCTTYGINLFSDNVDLIKRVAAEMNITLD